MVSTRNVTARFSTGLGVSELGARVRAARRRRGLSLAALATRAGVSRSMLSDVERGPKAPTVLVLDQIATGLDTSIARLLGAERTERVVVLRREEQDPAVDPSGWERRILSPVLPGIEFELMRTTIAPGSTPACFSPHAAGSREYLALERGTLRLTIDGVPHTLHAGTASTTRATARHAFANPGRGPASTTWPWTRRGAHAHRPRLAPGPREDPPGAQPRPRPGPIRPPPRAPQPMPPEAFRRLAHRRST